MQWRKNRVAIGGAAFLGLLAVTLWAVEGRDRAPKGPSEVPTIELDKEAMTSLEITRPDDELVVLSKVDGVWRVTDPVDAGADQNNVESALNRPLQLFHYGDPAPDLCALAAAYAFGIAKNHPFFDGNKRTAAVLCELFLDLNGVQFTIGEVEKYPYFFALASGEVTEDSFAAWLRENTAPVSATK